MISGGREKEKEKLRTNLKPRADQTGNRIKKEMKYGAKK